MRVMNPSSYALPTPSISQTDARWAADALASLVRQLDADSVVGLVLQRTQRELMSLAASPPTVRTESGSEVIGPVRVRMAA